MGTLCLQDPLRAPPVRASQIPQPMWKGMKSCGGGNCYCFQPHTPRKSIRCHHKLNPLQKVKFLFLFTSHGEKIQKTHSVQHQAKFSLEERSGAHRFGTQDLNCIRRPLLFTPSSHGSTCPPLSQFSNSFPSTYQLLFINKSNFPLQVTEKPALWNLVHTLFIWC